MLRALPALLVLALVGAACETEHELPERVASAVADAGKVLVLGTVPGEAPEGVAWTTPSVTTLGEALALPPDAPGGRAAAGTLREHGIGAVLVETGAGDAESDTVAGALTALRHVPGLLARVIGPRLAVYGPETSAGGERGDGAVLARVARRILSGEAPPRVSRFPERYRRLRGSVEVMVLLRSHGRARLWRSARGNSIGRALSTASLVARRRWAERENAMGGPLAEKLAHLDVEVSLLAEDGTFEEVTRPLLDRAVRPVHGVGYDRPGAWRYLLPEAARERGGGSGAGAFDALLEDNELPPEALSRRDLRFYRFVVQPLGTSAAPAGRSRPTDPLDPAGVLEAASADGAARRTPGEESRAATGSRTTKVAP